MMVQEAARAYGVQRVAEDTHATIHQLPVDERPRERLLKHGAQALRAEELLAILLRTGTKKENVVELAGSLLAKYHGIAGIMGAECRELCAEYGLGEAKATQIKAALELGRRARLQLVEDELPVIKLQQDVMSFVSEDMMYQLYEQMRVLVLDSKHRVLENIVLYKGTVNSSVLRAAEVFRAAILRNAPSIILCHNHPSGDPTPSDQDRSITIQLKAAAKSLDIGLLDHVIIGRNCYVSMKEVLGW